MFFARQCVIKRRVFGCVRVPCTNCARGCELLGWKRIMSLEERNEAIDRWLRKTVWKWVIRILKIVQPYLAPVPAFCLTPPKTAFQDFRRVVCNFWEPLNFERRMAREFTFCEYAVSVSL